MYKYILGLQQGGLMEDPDWHIELGSEVYGKNLIDAKDNWARKLGEDKRDTWNAEYQTVWGWSIKVLLTNDPNVEEKDFYKL